MALSHRYPRNLEYKMLQRQAQCLVRLARYNQAAEVRDIIECTSNNITSSPYTVFKSDGAIESTDPNERMEGRTK